ncbi:MAG: tetratricopeptide repeat protein [Terriglobales bacterium]
MGTHRQIRVTLLLAVLGAGSMSAAGQTVRHHKIAEPDPSFPPELIQAESDIEKKDYAGAEPLLKKVVADDAKNYQAWFDLGFVYNAQGNSTDSIAAYRKSVAAKPDVFESNLNLGISLAKAGQPDAERFLRAATTLKPTANVDEGCARAWLSLAHVLETSKPEEAIAAYQRAAALTPKDAEPHLAAGTLLVNADHFADAEQEYKQALSIDPASNEALIGLANLYTRGNRFLDAEQVLEKIVTLHPDDTQARLLLSRVLVQMGKNDEAAASAQAASKLDPGNPKIQRELADLYMSAKKYDQAEAVYRSLLKGKTDNPADLHHVLGVALLKQRKFPEAEQECLAAVKLKPDLGEAYGDLAVAAVENKDYQLAIKAADARAKFLPEIPIGYFLRASAYDHLRAYKPAAQNYHKFLEVANGQYPDQEWQARHRLIAIEPKK